MESIGKRDYTYDWLRIIATIFVVIGHSAYISMSSGFGGINYEISETVNAAFNSPVSVWFRFMAGWVYGFHMPLFFMLSGAVFAIKPIAVMDNIVKAKVKRLLIPFFFYGWLFMLPIKCLGNFYTVDNLNDAMKAFLSGAETGHLWFLIALFWVFIVCATILKTLNHFGVKSVYVFLFICGIISLTYQYIPFDIFCFKLGLGYIFWFALGYVFENERKNNKSWNLKTTVFAVLVLFVLEYCNIKFDLFDSFFVIVVGAFFTYLIADVLNRTCHGFTNTGAWKILNRNLFYIYLFHDPLEYVVLRIFMNGNWMNSAIGCYLYLFSRIVGIFFVCIILGEIVRVIKGKAEMILTH